MVAECNYTALIYMEMHWFESNSAISPIVGELKTSDLSGD